MSETPEEAGRRVAAAWPPPPPHIAEQAARILDAAPLQEQEVAA